jgi:hypothetical protein
MRRILGDGCAGVFDEIEKDSTLPSVLAATAAARAANADLLISVGGGSVTQATRVVAILLAEKGAPHDLITQYPDNAPAISPKLLAPKLPIINVLTGADLRAEPRRLGAARRHARPPHGVLRSEDAAQGAVLGRRRAADRTVFLDPHGRLLGLLAQRDESRLGRRQPAARGRAPACASPRGTRVAENHGCNRCRAAHRAVRGGFSVESRRR